MVRMSELHHSIPGVGAKDDVPRESNHAEETRSDRLAAAKSVEERQAIFEDYIEGHAGEFDEDCKAVAKLLQENDRGGLVEHGSRHAPERAAARAAAIRAGR